jgi:hypothetical protein
VDENLVTARKLLFGPNPDDEKADEVDPVLLTLLRIYSNFVYA